MSLVTYQNRVYNWLLECFGVDITNSRKERVHRFWEEAIELGQSVGCTEQEAIEIVRYVFSRPKGEPEQETGGVMVCLAALCTVHDIDMMGAAEKELHRVYGMMEKIRAKHARKPQFSALPGASEPEQGVYPAKIHFSSVKIDDNTGKNGYPVAVATSRCGYCNEANPHYGTSCPNHHRACPYVVAPRTF